ncbi:MAG TPA: dTMP kinase [Actinomycetota bacterium]|nr:dTMP kinase [Actinomycetota bacterium]
MQRPQAPHLQAVQPPDEEVSYLTLLRSPNFLRFFLAQSVSSLGDWIGVIAIAVFAQRLGGTTAVGAVMTARVLPGFLVGPLGGVLADRWDRRKTMVIADVVRALIIFSLPFVPNLIYLLLASALLESLTLIWGPAKDASLPHFVPQKHLTHANSLSLIAIYGPWPIASVLFASLTSLGGWLGDHVTVMEGLQGNNEALALWIDSLTFLFSGIMISGLSIPSSQRRSESFDLGAVKRDLVEGLRFVGEHKQVRPWLLGIAFTFTAAGGVFSLGVEFVDKILGGGEAGFAFLIGFLGTGMIAGLLASGALAKKIQKDVLFTSSLFLLGAALIGLASMGSLDAAIPVASALGFFGGVAYSTAYSLMQETTRDDLRGRTFSAAYTLIRIGTLLGLGIFPLVAGAIGDHRVAIGGATLALPGSRITLWLAGLVVMGGGRLSMKAIRARGSAALEREAAATGPGYMVAFEGGEGAGKSTQVEAFARWLEARGMGVVQTREPGGTPIGERIRDILLDRSSAALDARAEALLYAADRAQHFREVVRPALEEGKVVISDRSVDSSLAYQGLARGLGVDDIFEVSAWATDGLLPHLVFFLDLDPEVGIERAGGDPDRMELESITFHRAVRGAYHELARRYPERLAIVDASGTTEEIHRAITTLFLERTEGSPPFDGDLPASPTGGPLPR